MLKKLQTAIFALTLVTLCFLTSSCIFFSVRPERVDKPAKRAFIWPAGKVHLSDGSVVVFPRGFEISKGVVKGQESGIRYDLLRNKVGRVESVPLDSVAYMQRYTDHVLGKRLTAGVAADLVYFFSIAILAVAAWPHHHIVY